MTDKGFSSDMQLAAVFKNLKKHKGKLKCSICSTTLKKRRDCHFDKSFPEFANGELINCQIICKKCKLQKIDEDCAREIQLKKAHAIVAKMNIKSQ